MTATHFTRSLCFAITGLLTSVSPLAAADVTPSHVFQVTETLVQELKELNAENFTESANVTAPTDEAMPRHVFFLARDQWRRVQLLRFMNGLETHGLQDVKVHKISPSEVKQFVDRLLVEAQELRPTYGLGTSHAMVDLPNGKKPKDVYASLLRVSGELQALGVPATVPNDVFRVAVSLRQSLSTVAQSKNISVDASQLAEESGRTPSDVYHAGLELLTDMQTLASDNTAYTVPGAITVPTPKSGAISPDDVIVVLSRAYADVMALMNATGSAPNIVFAPYEGGKTPSDVYREIKHARLIIAALAQPAT